MPYEALRYNDVRQKSVHNAFQRKEGIYDQVIYWRVRSLEVDLHRSKLFRPRLSRDWYVYHSTFDDHTTVDTLRGFLMLCRGIRRALPQHEVITLFLDIKDPFHVTPSASQSGRALDRLLDTYIGGSLYRPRDLLARAPGASTLQEAVAAGGWPTLAELRGKFVVVLTGSDEQLGDYNPGESGVEDRSAFLSCRVESIADIGAVDEHIVFFNMDGKNVHLARPVQEAGFVARSYYLDSERRWQEGVDRNCHHLATDKVNTRRDSWATTSGLGGFPFEALTDETPTSPEPGELCGMWARSGDIWGERDSFLFHFEACPPDRLDNRYELFLSGPNSHVDDWVKAGVMARVDLLTGSPYLGVFRVGEKHGLRMQYRAERNGSTTAIERQIGREGLYEQDNLIFVRLQIGRDGHHARVWGSVSGWPWVGLGEYEFAEPLVHQGLGVSSHGEDRGVKFLIGVPRGRLRPTFDRTRMIGKRDTSDDGWVDWAGERRWRVDDFDEPERVVRGEARPE